MADKNIAVILIIAAVIALVYFGGNVIANPGEKPSGAGDYETEKVEWFFADENFNDIELDKDETFSVVQVPGFAESSGIYFMRLNVKVTNDGGIAKEVEVTDVNVKDANGNLIESTIVTKAFRCILNRQQGIGPGQDYTWSTDPDDVTTGCSSLSWMPTTVFEGYAQPLTVIADIKASYTLFGIRREINKQIPGQIAIANDTGGFGTILGEILGGGVTGFLSECDAGETQLCPYADVTGSVCKGVSQSCFVQTGGEAGLWPGCSLDSYGTDFVPNKESNKDPAIYCKDGLDNDCDGTYDKPNIDGTCPRGNCDNDCPVCIVNFRTNADVDAFAPCTVGGECANQPYVPGYWISVGEISSDEFLISYGYGSKRSYISTISKTCAELLSGTDSETGYEFVGFTPKQNMAIHKRTDGDVVRLFYEDDSSSTATCSYIQYRDGETSRCKIGDEDYPVCILRESIYTYNLANQETCVDY